MHLIVDVTIFQHALGDSAGGMFSVGQHADFFRTLDEGSVKFGPRPPRERNDTHIMIRHHQAMRQQLQGVERREQHNLGIRHLALDGVGKTEKQRVSTGKHNHLIVILLEYRIQRRGNLNPLRPLGQIGCNKSVMALAARENTPFADKTDYLRRQIRPGCVTDTYNVKLHIIFCINSNNCC